VPAVWLDDWLDFEALLAAWFIRSLAYSVGRVAVYKPAIPKV
jgi:hypothetical protein